MPLEEQITHAQLVRLGFDSATNPSFAVIDGKVVSAHARVRPIKMSALLRAEKRRKKTLARRRKPPAPPKTRGGKTISIKGLAAKTRRSLPTPMKR